MKVKKDLTPDAAPLVAKNGHLDTLEWIMDNCYYLPYSLCSAAARGCFDVVKWLRDKGLPWNEVTCSAAAREGHLEGEYCPVQ